MITMNKIEASPCRGTSVDLIAWKDAIEQTRVAYSLWKAGSQELRKRSHLYISASIFKDNTEIPQKRVE